MAGSELGPLGPHPGNGTLGRPHVGDGGCGMSETAIRWEQSRAIPEWQHGYVGTVRGFTIERTKSAVAPWQLKTNLPDKGGLRAMEGFQSEQAAMDRAAVILQEFLAEAGFPART